MEEYQVTENSFIVANSVWQRLKQVSRIYKKNFIWLTLLILFYNIIAFAVSVWIWNQVITWLVGNDNIEENVLAFIMWNTASLIIAMLVFVIGILSYIIFFIPVFVGTLKSMRDAISEKEIRVSENLRYGFSQFFNVLKVYWYIFQYVFLTPALVLIAGLLVILIALISDIDSLYIAWWLLLGVALITWIVYGVYRWLRSTFRLYAAIDQEDFTKQFFVDWLEETRWKLWRILWNFIVIGLIVWISTWILGWIINIITGVNIEEDSQNIISSFENNEWMSWEDLREFQIDGAIILNGVIITFIEAVGMIFITLFTYILYLRIRDEYKKNKSTGENQDIQKNSEI